jgi:hypothetical protein
VRALSRAAAGKGGATPASCLARPRRRAYSASTVRPHQQQATQGIRRRVAPSWRLAHNFDTAPFALPVYEHDSGELVFDRRAQGDNVFVAKTRRGRAVGEGRVMPAALSNDRLGWKAAVRSAQFERPNRVVSGRNIEVSAGADRLPHITAARWRT